ncbi:MAG: A24 family peptidase [Rhodoferax sp.]
MMALPPMLSIALMGLLGLLVGSFLNVVIYRLPIMLQARWTAECKALMAEESTNAGTAGDDALRFNLLVPRSRCPHCEHPIAWFENIPLLSYVLLRGRCRQCHAPIGLRYPLVELACGLLFAACAWQWGATATGLAHAGLCAALLTAALIDWDTTLLPDDLTLPLLWAGLVLAALHITPVNLSDALWGAVAGYVALWLVFWAFKLATGKEGMGYGDFKLLAALGAWLGWQALVPVVLLSSIIGALIGLALKARGGLREGGYVPFGPFLAGAGLVTLGIGPHTVLALFGLG